MKKAFWIAILLVFSIGPASLPTDANDKNGEWLEDDDGVIYGCGNAGRECHWGPIVY